MPPKGKRMGHADGQPASKKKHQIMDDEGDTETYRKKRDRNNIAVKKSRERTKQKARETMEKVDRLKKENEDLEMKVQVLSKELSLLKDLFLSNAGPVSSGFGYSESIKNCAKNNVVDLGSNGESDDSNSSEDGHSGAGPLADAEVIQRDHEYSASPIFMIKAEEQ